MLSRAGVSGPEWIQGEPLGGRGLNGAARHGLGSRSTFQCPALASAVLRCLCTHPDLAPASSSQGSRQVWHSLQNQTSPPQLPAGSSLCLQGLSQQCRHPECRLLCEAAGHRHRHH